MNIIYVDDEKIAAAKFEFLARQIPEVATVDVFASPTDALKSNEAANADIAFLDIEMPEMSGLELAQELKNLNHNIRIVFVTAYENYALKAFQADAVDYLLKPYDKDRLVHALQKAKLIKKVAKKRVFIKTFGGFDVFIDGQILPITQQKPKELLALLVDKRGSLVSVGTAIACLWEERPNDEATGALYRMTGKRLRELLISAGISDILAEDGYRAVKADAFECDYYDMLDGDAKAAEAYKGDYMPEYSWAEETNAKLSYE